MEFLAEARYVAGVTDDKTPPKKRRRASGRFVKDVLDKVDAQEGVDRLVTERAAELGMTEDELRELIKKPG